MNCLIFSGALGTVLGLCSTLSAGPLDTWHVRSAPLADATLDLTGIAYGNGRWVAVGEDGLIISSTNGVEWNAESNPAPNDLQDIAFGGGLFVAFGSQFNNLITSPDGQHWTKQTPGFSGAFEMIHDGTRFLSVLAGGFVVASIDGIHWQNLATCQAKYDVGGIAFGNNIYVEAGYKRTGTPPDLYTTPDLNQWSQRDSRATENLMNVAFGLGTFIAVGQKGTITTSPDGINWTPRTSKHTGFIWDVATDGKRLVSAAQSGRILTSDDAVNWIVHETGLSGHLTDIAYGGGTFVAVGWDGQIVQSDSVGEDSTIEIRLSHPAKAVTFSFEFNSEIGKTYRIEGSADFKSWATINTLVASGSLTVINDADATPPRFYRVIKP